MDSIGRAYCDVQMSHVAWFVCLSVCCTHGELCKTGEPIEMLFGGLTRVGQRNHLQIPQREGVILGVVRPTEKHWENLLRCTQKRLNQS